MIASGPFDLEFETDDWTERGAIKPNRTALDKGKFSRV